MVQKEQNTEHSRQRVCNEYTMKGIKRLRIVKDILRLSSYDYADTLFLNACALHNFRVKSPLRAYARADTHVTKINSNSSLNLTICQRTKKLNLYVYN